MRKLHSDMKSECKYSLLEAKSRLENLCAYQERCSFDLNRKMLDWGLGQEDRDALLADLITNNFLSEERYAEAFVSGKINIKKWGRIKIQQHLKAKFISKYSILKGLNSIDEDVYLNNLNNLLEKKMNTLSSEKDPFTKKNKVYRYLSSKGYESDYIREAFKLIE